MSASAPSKIEVPRADPNRISDDDVRTVLAAAPTPHIILIHGGVIGVYLMMESFGNFLVGMGYPVDKIRDPHDGAFSQSLWQQ